MQKTTYNKKKEQKRNFEVMGWGLLISWYTSHRAFSGEFEAGESKSNPTSLSNQWDVINYWKNIKKKWSENLYTLCLAELVKTVLKEKTGQTKY